MLFELRGITKSFGGLVANSDVSLSIDEGEIIGLIGPNGAGKSTLFKTISGYIKPDTGTITFDGKSITGLAPYKVCRRGIACTFQDAKNFPQLEAIETVMVGAYCRYGAKAKAMAHTRDTLAFLGLALDEGQTIDKLNMYDRKKLTLAAALSTEPKLLLLDELFAGCTPTEVSQLLDILHRVNKELGITLFIIEHVLKVIMSACQRIVVLENGKVLETGTPEEISHSKKVINAYLGEDYDASQY